MTLESTKIINKIIDNILADHDFLDDNIQNNISILDALINSGINSYVTRLNLQFSSNCDEFSLSKKSQIDSYLIKCIQAIQLICLHMPKILSCHNFSNTKSFSQSRNRSPEFYYIAISNSLIKLFRFNLRMINDKVFDAIYTIMIILTIKLKTFIHRRKLSDFLVSKIITVYLNKALTNDSVADILISLNGFRLLVSEKLNKLLLVSGSLDLKINTIARKIWFISNGITENSLKNEIQVSFLDSLFGYYISSEINISSTRFVLVSEIFNDLFRNLVSNEIYLSVSLQDLMAKYLLDLDLNFLKLDLQDMLLRSINFECLSLLKSNKNLKLTKSLAKTLIMLLNRSTKKTGKTIRFWVNDESLVGENFEGKTELLFLENKLIEIDDFKNGKNNFGIASCIELENKVEMIELREESFIKVVARLDSYLVEHSKVVLQSDFNCLQFLQVIRKLCCASNGSYDYEDDICLVCENTSMCSFQTNKQSGHSCKPVIELILQLLVKHFLKRIQPSSNNTITINLLICLKTIFLKICPPPIKLDEDLIFQFLCACMRSTNRDVRIFSSKLFPSYLVSDDDYALNTNWNFIFEFLDKKLAIEPHLNYLAEAKIMAWGELMIVLEGEPLNVVLAKLLDFFSSSNSFFACISYTTLLNVATLKNESCWQLVNPFLPNLSLTLAQQIANKTIFGSIIPGFLNLSANDILVRTIPYTVPYLLTYYSKDVIKEIAKVSKMSKFTLVSQVLPKIISVMLTSEQYLSVKIEKEMIVDQNQIMEILSIVDHQFKSKRFEQLIEPVQTIWELCKMYSYGLSSNELLIKNAIIYIIKVVDLKRNPDSSKMDILRRYNLMTPQNEEDDKILQNYFKGSLLGVIQLFSDVVKNTRGKTPYLEKVRSLTAIEFLVQISGNEVITALPQICISLQKSIGSSILEFNTLRCWKVLINNLDDNDISTCFDLLVAIVLQRWSSFRLKSKKVAKEILIELFSKKDLIRDKFFNYYFTLSFYEGLEDVYSTATEVLESKRKKKKSSIDMKDQSMVLNLLYDITRRCGNDNKYVVQQSLNDLENFMIQYKGDFPKVLLRKPKFINFVPTLIHILLNNCSKFKSQDKDFNISEKCAYCLSLIGCLDPDKFEFKNKNKELLGDFMNPLEMQKFINPLLNVLVKAFWASEDPGLQIFLAYGMQEFLKLTGRKTIEEINGLLDLSQSTLYPLLSSKYELNFMSDRVYEYPIFKATREHSDWVRTFTLDLLQKCKQSFETADPNMFSSKYNGIKVHHAKSLIKFYTVYGTLIKGQDISISLIILPHAARTMIVKNFQNLRQNILNEFLSILETDNGFQTQTTETSHNLKLYYQTVFKIIDFIKGWISRKAQIQYMDRMRRKRYKNLPVKYEFQEEIDILQSFLNQIPNQLIAERSSKNNSFERALLYLEQDYRCSQTKPMDSFSGNAENTSITNMTMSQLQSMYEKLEDYDSLSGLLTKFSLDNIDSIISQIQYEDNWNDTLGAFEVVTDEGCTETAYREDYKYLGYLNKKGLHGELSLKLDNVLKTHAANSIGIDIISANLLDIGLECSILQGDINNLRKWISIAEVSNLSNDSKFLINYLIAKSLLSLGENENRDMNFNPFIKECYKLIGSHLSHSPISSLSRNQNIMRKLHVLSDIKAMPSQNMEESTFYERVFNSGSGFDTPWYIMTLQKTCLKVLVNKANEKLWQACLGYNLLMLSKTELAHNRSDLASKSVVESYLCSRNVSAEIEFSEILWKKGDHLKALKIIESLKKRKDSLTKDQVALIQWKYAHWLEASSNSLESKIIEEFEEAIKLNKKWEEPHFYLGKYYNKILETRGQPDVDNLEEYGFYTKCAITNYMNSLTYGSKYLQEILPKVITIWIQYSDLCLKYKVEKTEAILDKINFKMRDYFDLLPKFYWFAVFSQILSKISHTFDSTFESMKQICMILLRYYPEQAYWNIFAQLNSNDKHRSHIGKRIVSPWISEKSVFKKYGSNQKLFDTMNAALQSFSKIYVSSKKFEKSKNKELSISSDLEFDHGCLPAPLAVPFKQNFEFLYRSIEDEVVTIVKVDDVVQVMSSLQKPKKVSILGSDGKKYKILFKINDDLRKDAKLMESTSMIDHSLEINYDSKKRHLHINTFAVLPLNEAYGIIEWVDNHTTMKSILDRKYEKHKLLLTVRKEYTEKKELEEKNKYFNHLLKIYKPVLYSWFIEVFSTPSLWYESRINFTRSTAVMSMVGSILGIGDRHGENILISQLTGSVLHVDFDCLFEKGTTLRIPERVPFRLTSNMVDAFGITGVEGTFKKSSEVTMQLLRHNESLLMNILEAFIYDPIMDWKKENNKLGTPEETLEKIRKKLRGILEADAMPMSCPGQVNFLITQATSSVLLCQMYFGWLPFW